MSVVWEFRPSLVVVTSTGVYPLEAVAEAVGQAAADSRFEPGMSVLFDGRGSEVPVSSGDVDWRIRFVASLPTLGFSSRIGMLVRDGFLSQFGEGRQISLSPERTREHEAPDGDPSAPTLRLFASEDEAIAWLLGERPR